MTRQKWCIVQRKTGSDIAHGEIMVVSFDAVNKEALQYVLEDKITCIAECNPLHGPRVMSIIETLENDETPEKFSYVDEQLFSAYKEISTVEVDGKKYPLTMVTPDMVVVNKE